MTVTNDPGIAPPATPLAELLDAVANAPEGSDTVAFFDYDGTVIGGYSGSAFYRRRLFRGEIGAAELVRTVRAGWRGVRSDEDFAEFLTLWLEAWAGKPESELRALGDELFRAEIAGQLHPEVWELVAAHRARGHRVVLASSATRFQVEPMARELGADAVLCTELETVDGVLTGRTVGVAAWGAGKAAVVTAYAAEHDVDLTACFGYANGAEDVAFLRAVGNPVAVAPTDTLRTEAEAARWPVLECVPRGGLLPSAGDLVRTAAFYGGLIGGLGTGLGIGLLRGSRRQGFDVMCTVGAEIGLTLAGIEVNVQGAEHLVSARPCVFVINHQSGFDVPVVMKLLRGGFTGVVKKETAKIPVWGQIFQLADVAFVDRADGAQARAALEPAVRRLRDEGVSLAIAPEGTRSPTPRLGPFKKGAFHIAMQAQVPMVPIVIRNAGEIMGAGMQTIRAGTVDVAVLAPVDTSAWRPETVAEHVEQVRDMFVRTLAEWPGAQR